MKRENLIAILLFFTGVLLFTRIDFFVNSSLYNYGLKFNENWYVEYLNLYALCYQLLILSLLAYTRSLKLFISMETFILTSTQDIVYFSLWQGTFPKTEWTWTPFYKIIGNWTTTHQITLSLSANLLFSLAIILHTLAKQRQTSTGNTPPHTHP